MSREDSNVISHALRLSAEKYIDAGGFFSDLAKMVAHPTVSTDPDATPAITTYLDHVLAPALRDLGCTVTKYANPDPVGGPFLVGRRVESADLPTLLCYGHADVVDGHAGQWSEGRDPWTLTADGDRWYGRGSADNKGQHLINLSALRLLLEQRGALGFNLIFLFETGEEIDSPGLAEFVTAHKEELRADLMIASDGPRLDATTPTLFLGARGIAEILLEVDLRRRTYHSGNWGGVLRNPATTLAAAISTLVDGHGRIKVPALLPPELSPAIRQSLDGVLIANSPGDPTPDEGWGEPGLSNAERLFAWNTLEVIAFAAADIAHPVPAIPGVAKAALQLRFVTGTDVSQIEEDLTEYLAARGFPMVSVSAHGHPSSRTPVDDPWVVWAKSVLDEVADRPIAVLPNIGGTLPNYVFTDILGVPTLWLPHSYPGCGQHGPDEHMLAPIAREGLLLATALYESLGMNSPEHPLPA